LAVFKSRFAVLVRLMSGGVEEQSVCEEESGFVRLQHLFSRSVAALRLFRSLVLLNF
jgi:hypothetical protein